MFSVNTLCITFIESAIRHSIYSNKFVFVHLHTTPVHYLRKTSALQSFGIWQKRVD